MRYKTNLLDEATFLILKGFRYSIKRTGGKSSTFSFEDTKEVQSARKQFYTGNIQVNLHRWLCIRQQLKYEVSQLLIFVKKFSSKGIEVKNGDKYYFVEHNKIMSALFGDNEIHSQRIESGNFFLKLEDASKKIK